MLQNIALFNATCKLLALGGSTLFNCTPGTLERPCKAIICQLWHELTDYDQQVFSRLGRVLQLHNDY